MLRLVVDTRPRLVAVEDPAPWFSDLDAVLPSQPGPSSKNSRSGDPGLGLSQRPKAGRGLPGVSTCPATKAESRFSQMERQNGALTATHAHLGLRATRVSCNQSASEMAKFSRGARAVTAANVVALGGRDELRRVGGDGGAAVSGLKIPA